MAVAAGHAPQSLGEKPGGFCCTHVCGPLLPGNHAPGLCGISRVLTYRKRFLPVERYCRCPGGSPTPIEMSPPHCGWPFTVTCCLGCGAFLYRRKSCGKLPD